MKKNILPIKKTLKTMFLATFLCASFLNTITMEQAYGMTQDYKRYEIAGSDDYYKTNSGFYDAHGSVYEDLAQSKEVRTKANLSHVKQVVTKVFLDGKEVTFPNGIINYEGNTYLPMRDFGELLNAKVEWLDKYKVAEIKVDSRTIGIPSEHKFAVIDIGFIDSDGNQQYASAEPVHITSADGSTIASINYNSRLYLPMRFICEYFGYNVDYTQQNPLTKTSTIEIYKGERPEIQLGQKYQNTNKWRPVGVTVGTEEQWEKFYTQKHPVTGATPIQGTYLISNAPEVGDVFTPLFDHNGDGRIGNTSIRAEDANGKFYLRDNTISIDEFKTLGNEEKRAKYKHECINWYRNSVANTKPTTRGKKDFELSPDNNWAWSADINDWTQAKGINAKGTEKVFQAKGTYHITTITGEDRIK